MQTHRRMQMCILALSYCKCLHAMPSYNIKTGKNTAWCRSLVFQMFTLLPPLPAMKSDVFVLWRLLTQNSHLFFWLQSTVLCPTPTNIQFQHDLLHMKEEYMSFQELGGKWQSVHFWPPSPISKAHETKKCLKRSKLQQDLLYKKHLCCETIKFWLVAFIRVIIKHKEHLNLCGG